MQLATIYEKGLGFGLTQKYSSGLDWITQAGSNGNGLNLRTPASIAVKINLGTSAGWAGCPLPAAVANPRVRIDREARTE